MAGSLIALDGDHRLRARQIVKRTRVKAERLKPSLHLTHLIVARGRALAVGVLGGVGLATSGAGADDAMGGVAASGAGARGAVALGGVATGTVALGADATDADGTGVGAWASMQLASGAGAQLGAPKRPMR